MTERFIFMKFQKKKNLPHAYHEAKIYMALFKQYQVINELETQGGMPHKINDQCASDSAENNIDRGKNGVPYSFVVCYGIVPNLQFRTTDFLERM